MNLRDIRIALNLVPAVGSRLSQRVTEFFPSPDAIVSASKDELLGLKGVGTATAEAIKALEWKEDIEREKSEAARKGVYICVLGDNDYPARLLEIYDPPPVLYFKGKRDLLNSPVIAVVGSRIPSVYGKIAVEKLSSDLATRGITIVSGFARGIDSGAHGAVLRNNGATVAVLGSGLNCIYPPENRNLFKEISDRGLLISEFPMNRRPDRMNFPRRNRIISGLSEGVLVVEAAEKSGSLITADFALEQGREVFAVPGNINSPKSRGTNGLIKKGAVVTETWRDVMNELSEDVRQRLAEPLLPCAPKGRDGVVSDEEKTLLSFITNEEIHIDFLTKKAQLPPGIVSAILLKLEMKGLVRKLPGNFYVIDI